MRRHYCLVAYRPIRIKKKKKKGEQKSQKCDISPLCGGAPCEPISTKFGVFVGLTNVITCARPTGGKTQVSL